MTKGIYTHAFDPAGSPGVILRASGGATIAGPDLTREGRTASAEEALFLGVDAMATTAFIGSGYEHETLVGMAAMGLSIAVVGLAPANALWLAIVGAAGAGIATPFFMGSVQAIYQAKI